MPTIKQLPEHLINQIAAGEVVERPASVIKELLENSLDAGAKRIIIEINDGGDGFVRITDDGSGMDKEDAVMAFERHATSKIASIDDLSKILTLGFRGEAIASIASVSFLTLQTKKKGALEGTLVISEGGNIKKVATIGAPEGTQIEMRNLFYNTPARKKYLKNPSTEFGHILSVVTGTALAFPEVAIKLVHDGKPVFDLPQTEDDLGRIRALLGRSIADELVPIFYGHASMQLKGFVGKPSIARAGRQSQYLFVNRREVKSHVLSYAVKQSFHSLLPKERYPVFILFFSIDPALIDVNVHPRKTEIRFRDEKEIFRIVTSSTKKALEDHVLAPKITNDRVLDAINSYETTRPHQSPLLFEDRPVSVPDFAEIRTDNVASFTTEMVKENITSGQPVPPDNAPSCDVAASRDEAVIRDKAEPDSPGNESFETRREEREIVPLVQLENSYILCRQEKGLVIVDQHAAHERIRYTEILEQFEAKRKAVQPLLMPLQLELSHHEVSILKENTELINSFGFEIDHFGGNTFTVNAIPSFLTKQDVTATVMGLIDDIKNNAHKGDFQSRKEKALTYMACRSAVKFGDKLSKEEQEALLKKLLTVPLAYTCPHGRPTMITMSFEELERRFGRKYS